MGANEISGVVSVLAVAVSLLLAARVLTLAAPRPRAAEQVLRFTATVVIAAGLLGACLLALGGFGLVVWPIVMIVWGRMAINYRTVQKQNLLSALAIAIENDMPVAPMAAAFANEQEGGFSAKAQRLADDLQRGAPVGDVLRRSRQALPRESALAADIGMETGDMSAALDAAIYRGSFDRTWLQPVIGRLLYLLIALGAFIATLSFMNFRITPVMSQIQSDFRARDLSPIGPSATTNFAALAYDYLPEPVADWLAFNLPTGVLTGSGVPELLLVVSSLLGLLVLFVIGYGWLQWRGTLMPRLPWLRRIINWMDAGPMLRMLALAARRQRPLVGTLVAFARSHPKWTVRRRIRRVVRAIDNGTPWYDAMRRTGLLTKTDTAILAAAGYSGNLPWALDEMADSFDRRATYRMQAVAQTLVPLVMLWLGLATAVLYVQSFEPLTELILHLS